MVDGLCFALPTRSAAAQLHRRVKRFVEKLFPTGHTPPVVLAVPGYDAEEDADSIALEYNSHSAGHREGEERPWASEGPKRYLASQIAVGTVDQAMMAALKVRHAHMRAGGLPGTQPARGGRGARLGHIHATYAQGPPRLPSQCRRVCPVDVLPHWVPWPAHTGYPTAPAPSTTLRPWMRQWPPPALPSAGLPGMPLGGRAKTIGRRRSP